MHVEILNWLDQEFVSLSAEADSGDSAALQAQSLFEAFGHVLVAHGLSLSDTVRSRLFGRDRAARDAASEVRSDVLSGPARAATSSYIAPRRFASHALVAMDLLALRPRPGLEKRIRENDPPRTPCRYLTCGPLMVLSGQTAVLPTLDEQVTEDILPRISQYLTEAGSAWTQVEEANCYLHASQDPAHLRSLFLEIAPALPPRFTARFVEGYSAEGKLVEIEVTARRRI